MRECVMGHLWSCMVTLYMINTFANFEVSCVFIITTKYAP